MIWWMLQNFIVTAILAGCVWAVCRSWRIGPACQHALWLVLLVKLVTPPLISWPWAISHASTPHLSSTVFSAPRPAAAVVATVPQRSLAPLFATRSSDWLSDWLIPTIASVWISGCGVFILMQGKRIRVMLRLLRTAAPADSDLKSLVEEAARRVRTRAVDTRVASGIASPFIWCIHRPRLLWPAALSTGVPEEAIRGLLVHEMAHLKRKDHWIGWLELAAGCLWWWNPLYWYIRHQLRENAELACDAWVVETMDSTPGGRRAYAEALLAVCESIATPMTAVGANTSNRRLLERRLTMILRERFPLRLSRLGLLIVALIAAGALPMWTLKAASESPVAPVARSRTAVPVASMAAQGLPNDARELLKQFEERQAEVRRTMEATIEQQRRQLTEQLQALQDTHTKAGRLDEAVAVRDQIRRLQGIVSADVVTEYVNRVGQNIIRNSATKVPFTIKVIEPDEINAVALPGGFYYVNTGLILAADEEAKLAGAVAGEITHVVARNAGSMVFASEPPYSSNNLLRFLDQAGQTVRLRVTGLAAGPLWGTDVYTLDSDPGVAAVHAGLLQPGQEGLATIRILAGQAWYSGSTRNGVRSSSFDGFPGSYRIESMEGVQPTFNFAADELKITGGVRGRTGSGGETIFWTTRSNSFESSSRVREMRGHIGEALELEVTGSVEGAIWGSGVYTDDSTVEAAAVHAGLLKSGERGKIRVTILPGQSSYEGSLRNGVESESFGAFGGSYRIERVK